MASPQAREPEREPRSQHGGGDVDSQDLRGWLSSLGVQDIQVKVIRKSPRTYKGVNVEGTLQTYSEFIDEDVIREEHGGGVFSIVVYQRHNNGALRLFQTRMVKIAGPPKVDGLIPPEEMHSTESSSEGGANGGLAAQAMNSMQWQLKNAMEKAERAERSDKFDPNMMRMMQEPVLEQIRGLRDANVELQRSLADKDARIMELINRKPDTSLQDDLLKNMWSNESARIEGLRTQHESEMRQLRTFHADEISRIRDQSREDLNQRTRGHERELEAIRDAARSQVDSIKISYEARIDGLKSENARLTAEFSQLKGEIGELRSRKDKSLTEQAQEIVSVQEAFKALGVGGASKDEDDDSDKPWYERMASRVIENPEAIGQLIGGVRQNLPAGQPAHEVPQLPPPGQPFQGPDGRVYMTRPDGKVQRLSAGGVPPVKRAKAAAAKAAVEAKKEGPRAPDPAELALAVSFIESAVTNGTDPAAFAQGARSMIPADILAYIETVGVDEFLNGIKLDPSSPLRAQSGRNWIRQVAKILIEGE
jgi:hypothetical protein